MITSELYGNDCIKGKYIQSCILSRELLRRIYKSYMFFALWGMNRRFNHKMSNNKTSVQYHTDTKGLVVFWYGRLWMCVCRILHVESSRDEPRKVISCQFVNVLRFSTLRNLNFILQSVGNLLNNGNSLQILSMVSYSQFWNFQR